jgi:hypothetical protein
MPERVVGNGAFARQWPSYPGDGAITRVGAGVMAP